jgi:hypothetical protein
MEMHYAYLEVTTEYVFIICMKFAIRRRKFHIGAYVELIPNAVCVSAALLPLKI